MSQLQISCSVLLICFLSFSASAARDVEWSMQTMSKVRNSGPILLNANTTVSFKCKLPLKKKFSEIVDIYSVDYHGYETCNATLGKLLGSLKCGASHNNKREALEFTKKKTDTYYFIGFFRRKANPKETVLLGGTCKSHKTKIMIHFCDSDLTQNGSTCTMESCPLTLGLEDGRIKDEQVSASSELDDKHTANQGRVSRKTDKNRLNSAWCAASTFDVGTQYLQVDLKDIHAVSAVSTQGAVIEKSWVSGYLVHYSLDGTDWIVLTDGKGKIKVCQEFKGNIDQSSVVRHWLKPHFYARFVRFVPLSWVGQRCMRVELHGCRKDFPPVETLKRSLFGAPRPCEAANCANISYSICFMYSGKPQCKCIQSCTFEVAEVCGSDGVSYQNECALKQEACLNKKHVDIVKHGPCTECNGHCHKMSKPVCGSDGVTYQNECLLKKTACEKKKDIKIVNKGSCQGKTERKCASALTRPSVGMACNKAADACKTDGDCSDAMMCCHDGCRKVCVSLEQERFAGSSSNNLCAGVRCPPYAQCNRSDSGDTCVCPSCSHSRKKVCGSDGKTYKDSCELKKHSCKKNQHIKVVSQGGCATLPKAAVTGQKGKKSNGKKSIGSLRTLYISMTVVAVLGVLIALVMCIFQPHKSQQISAHGNASNRNQDTSFRRLHNKYGVEDVRQEDK